MDNNNVNICDNRTSFTLKVTLPLCKFYRIVQRPSLSSNKLDSPFQIVFSLFNLKKGPQRQQYQWKCPLKGL